MKKHILLCLLSVVLAVPVFAQEVEEVQEVSEDALPSPEEVELIVDKRDYSNSEIKLLQELEQRRIELDRREQALELRERLVDLAELRVVEKAERMAELQTELQQLLKNLSDKEEGELVQLSRIYEAMKPAAAASVLDRLDNNIVFDIFKRMKQKSSAKIMEKMSTAKARVISEMLAEPSDLPQFE